MKPKKPQLTLTDYRERIVLIALLRIFDRMSREPLTLYKSGRPADPRPKSNRRKPDAALVKRNLQICEMRRADPKKWSYGRLGKEFKMKRQSIDSILKQEAKWRKLSAK